MPETIRDAPAAQKNGIISSEPSRAWRIRADPERPKARFRLMSKCSVDMHVLSTHWMLTVGHKLESQLGPEAMGNRISRDHTGKLNRFSSGTFRYYLGPYKQWRDNGLTAMSDQLKMGKSLIALTADITSFYHRLHPKFLQDEHFLNSVLGVNLSVRELKTHALFTEAMSGWAHHVATSTGWSDVGLPVGLPASAVVANLALVELDRIAQEEFKPAYYARYVDDIILVIEEDRRLETHHDVWNWLIHRSRGLLSFSGDSNSNQGNDGRVRFHPPYLTESIIEFENRKNKIFHLSGPSGEAMIDSIKREIDARSSEWRSFTELPSDPNKVGGEIAKATQRDGEPASTLRDTDQVSVRRSAFAIKLRDFEAYERNLNIESWAGLRESFFRSIAEQVLVLPTFFDFADYLPRLIKLAAACGDAKSIHNLFDGMNSVIESVRDTCGVTVKSYAESEEASARVPVLQIWIEDFVRQAFDNLASGFTDELNTKEFASAISVLAATSQGAGAVRTSALKSISIKLRTRDLAHIPFRFSLLESDYVPKRSFRKFIRPTSDPSLQRLPLDPKLAAGADLLLATIRESRGIKSTNAPGREVAAIIFATRPPNEWELFLAIRRKANDQSTLNTISEILSAIRGYSSRKLTATILDGHQSNPTWVVKSDHANGKVKIALATVKTNDTSWRGAAIGNPDLSADRFERFKRLFQESVSKWPRPDYIILPEFAMPSQWFISFADKLRFTGSSLVSGIEYRDGGDSTVHNQVWASLRTGAPQSSSYVVYVQDKQKPAPFERALLHDLAGLRMVPEMKWEKPTVIAHGDFRFALLICSELTNIEYRSSLRGQIDALIVPEWNKDLHTFESLVESAALDIHAYIVQANHLSFGDSRIRAPRANEWERDIVRVRGGIHDHVVVGEIDYWSLRSHQSALHVQKGEFKPIPDGFDISPERRRLPKGSNPG